MLAALKMNLSSTAEPVIVSMLEKLVVPYRFAVVLVAELLPVALRVTLSAAPAAV